MKEYKICNLYVEAGGGTIGDYKFKRAEDYDEKIKLLYKPEKITKKFRLIFVSNNEIIPKQENNGPEIIYEPMRYGSHQVTALATIADDAETASVFSKDKTSIYDILLLYNFLIGQNACLETDIEVFSHLDKVGISLKKESSFTISYIISTALGELNNPEWKNGNKDKEILAFLYFLDAKDHKAFQLSFLQFFTAFEIFEPSDKFKGVVFDMYNISRIIPRFVKNDFKEIISVIRNCYIHNGECSIDKFKNEMISRNRATPAFKHFLDTLVESNFPAFKIDTSMVMDYILCRIFSKILNIEDKTGNFNSYYFDKVKKYFIQIYG